MAYYYLNKQFYNSNNSPVPEGALEISEEHFEDIFQKLEGPYKLIEDEKGYPQAVPAERTGKIKKELSPEEVKEKNRKMRKFAYMTRSDPLFFQYQRDEATKEEWIAEVEKIKKEFPI